ncbi:MAG: D-tyrosyl-tRNA(Tyr) deacylase [Candidatus Colwellbacteria bacterium]|nr:D-tyrosyl-tRNA(Tyr) deacylase [Candidatus Colwellbacteria bacterium]MBI4058926.1 D-tyrosyl-tRNA(Tyr) deacylase [Candidatus Microgenomates bacterium]
MKLIIQRVSQAKVAVDNQTISSIGKGLFVLVGVKEGDISDQAKVLAEKLAKLRVMADGAGKMNLTVSDVNGEMLAVSQFTLYADTSGGNRPSFIQAARPEVAQPIYEKLVEELKNLGVKVQTGKFGEYMEISATLDGPVTIIMES